MIYEVEKQGGRLFVTVEGGTVIRVESPTHGCFEANFIGDEWAKVEQTFKADGFHIIKGH